jgi:putative transposase
MRSSSKCAEDGRVRSCSALPATGIDEDGYREILGLQLGDSESERSWMDYFTWLKGRGLHGVALVVSDHHGGLTSAVRVQFQGASWQRCQMHLSANVSSAAPRAVQDELHVRVRAIFEVPDLQTARTLLAQVMADYEQRAPTATATHVGARL